MKDTVTQRTTATELIAIGRLRFDIVQVYNAVELMTIDPTKNRNMLRCNKNRYKAREYKSERLYSSIQVREA